MLAIVPALAHAEAIPLPGVKLVAEGCSPCRDGDRVRVVLHTFRPGVSIGEAEIRATVRAPSGQVFRLLPISGTAVTLPAGPSSVVILDRTVSDELPGIYLIEAGLLDVATGATIGRDVLGVVRE